jgi:thermolysin
VRTALDIRACFVSASTGDVLLDYSELKAQRPAPPQALVFDLRGDASRAAGWMARSVQLGAPDLAAEAPASDRTAAAARDAVAATSAFFWQRFGRLGIDGRGSRIRVIVHPADGRDWAALGPRYAHLFAGAFWDGESICLGDGLPEGERFDGRAWRPAATALDIVAHEFAHGVLDHSSQLVYRGESGALAEAFADVMATAVEFSAQPPGRGAGRADYEIGEDAAGAALRSLGDPGSTGHPDHLAAVAGASGVHRNSTVASHAYFLAIEGGTNRTSGLRVEGVGRARRDQVERAFYRAFAYLLPSAAGFAVARAATIQSATDLYGAGSPAASAIAQAWSAVGVR